MAWESEDKMDEERQLSEEEQLTEPQQEEEAAAEEEKEPLLEEQTKEQLLTALEKELELQREKHLRLYAEFENFKKRAVRQREEALRGANEDLVRELLSSLDNLETALKHAADPTDGLAQGVEMTLRELKRTLEKFGLTSIEAMGQPFNPEFHHAIAQVERDDVPEMSVVEEFRAGYMFGGRVIRASLVAVSKKPKTDTGESEIIDKEEL